MPYRWSGGREQLPLQNEMRHSAFLHSISMPVGQVPVVTGKAAVDGVQLDPAFFIKASQSAELSLEAALIGGSKPAHDLARFGQIKMKSKIIHALTERENMRFLV